MTNLEFYKDKLDKLAEDKRAVIKDGQFAVCNECECKDMTECFEHKCSFIEADIYKWLTAEHVEEPEVDWSKVKVDTPILVSSDGKNWEKRHFAFYNPNMEMVAVWNYGQTSWTANDIKDYCYWGIAKLADVEDAADEEKA